MDQHGAIELEGGQISPVVVELWHPQNLDGRTEGLADARIARWTDTIL